MFESESLRAKQLLSQSELRLSRHPFNGSESATFISGKRAIHKKTSIQRKRAIEKYESIFFKQAIHEKTPMPVERQEMNNQAGKTYKELCGDGVPVSILEHIDVWDKFGNHWEIYKSDPRFEIIKANMQAMREEGFSFGWVQY